MKNKNINKNNSLPTTTDLFIGHRSEIALSAIFRTGAGKHADKRRKKARKNDWKRESLLAD